MDHALTDLLNLLSPTGQTYVLILVVMDHALTDKLKTTNMNLQNTVLILVVMDHALTVGYTYRH